MKTRKLPLRFSGIITAVWCIGFLVGFLIVDTDAFSTSFTWDTSLPRLLAVNLLPLLLSIVFLRYQMDPLLYLIIGGKAFLFGLCIHTLWAIYNIHSWVSMLMMFPQCCCNVILLWLCYVSRRNNQCTLDKRFLQAMVSCILFSLADYLFYILFI